MSSYNDILIAKKEEYMRYIKEHVNNVIRAFDEFSNNEWLGKGMDSEIRQAVANLIENRKIPNHDASKYSDEEFEPYRRHFHSVDALEKEESEEDFEEAWKHHYTTNSHHFEHWIDSEGNPTEMDLESIIEMVCDWEGMSYKFGGSAKSWFDENKDKKVILHPNTKEKVEKILLLFCHNE